MFFVQFFESAFPANVFLVEVGQNRQGYFELWSVDKSRAGRFTQSQCDTVQERNSKRKLEFVKG